MARNFRHNHRQGKTDSLYPEGELLGGKSRSISSIVSSSSSSDSPSVMNFNARAHERCVSNFMTVSPNLFSLTVCGDPKRQIARVVDPTACDRPTVNILSHLSISQPHQHPACHAPPESLAGRVTHVVPHTASARLDEPPSRPVTHTPQLPLHRTHNNS